MPNPPNLESPTPKDPPYDLVLAQIELICADSAFKNLKTTANLLKYLVSIYHEGRYTGPFHIRRPSPDGQVILREFYEYRRDNFQDLMPTHPVTQGKRRIKELCAALQEFYGEAPDPTIKGSLEIKISRGPNSFYKPQFNWIPQKPVAALKSAEELPADSEHDSSARADVSDDHTTQELDGNSNLSLNAEALKKQSGSAVERIEPVARRLTPFASLPTRPTPFIPRAEITKPIIDQLIVRSDKRLITAVVGVMSGVGKSVVALSACYDDRVQSAFPDGIVWLTIGRQPTRTLEQLFLEVAAHLNVRLTNPSTTAYRDLFAGLAVLVVLDDVWTVDQVQPFRLEAGRSRYVVHVKE